ncbi:hypothetical protein CgunFtcFv8_017764 [Champsocephalus gunnari]|uniref:Interleukin-4 n=1 Tax=Champsocephalus gunnari TaxID=52237 RepID=A0AAN8HRJ6_CHAGU|nr:hypothetical protein CgunFtcFv8_017764 [Champsocephalus gunnari]
MAVMVYAASLHSTTDLLKDIRQEAGKLSNDNKSLTQSDLDLWVTKIECNQTDVDTFLCFANRALNRTRHINSFNKTDKLIRQLNQYNWNHTTSCVANMTNVEITLKALLDDIKTCTPKI